MEEEEEEEEGGNNRDKDEDEYDLRRDMGNKNWAAERQK